MAHDESSKTVAARSAFGRPAGVTRLVERQVPGGLWPFPKPKLWPFPQLIAWPRETRTPALRAWRSSGTRRLSASTPRSRVTTK
jgi:hypothetical protein